jgi:serine/threonine-protein kinase
MDQQPNDLIDNRYELGDPIGRGGMATIYKATDVHMHVEVAIKILRDVYSTDPKFVTRFQREARAARALQHPNIVQVYDYGQSGDAYFIVMELINGSDLRHYLKQEPTHTLPPDHSVEIAHDVALGLGAAHRRGIVHRDVKPQNILLNDEGLVKLTDFGIASMYKDADAERLTTTGMTLGTVQYYAPEQAQGEIVTPAADVYALGIVMYEMLTGRTPFDGDTPVAVAMRHIQDLPEPPSHLNRAIPPELERIILRCLEKDPRDRYTNGDALAYALDQYARGPQKRYGTAGPGSRPQYGPLGLPGIDAARSQPGRNAPFSASAVISGPSRGMPPAPGAGEDAFDAPTYEGYDQPLNGLSTSPWTSARRTESSGAVQGDDYDGGRKRNTGLIVAMAGGLVLLVGLACILVFVIGNSFLNGNTSAGQQLTTVPQFVGKQYLEAQAIATDKHLKLTEAQVASDKPAGQVIEQDVPSGERVKFDTMVTLTVSNGPGTVLVPDVTGILADAACTALSDPKVNLVCKVVKYVPSDQQSGTVISTDPPAQTAVKPGSTVNLTVSQGPAATPTPIPTSTPAPVPSPTIVPSPVPSPSQSGGGGPGA